LLFAHGDHDLVGQQPVIVGAWLCLLSPLAAAGLITLGGNRISRRLAGYVATLSCLIALGGALASFIALLGNDPEHRSVLSTAWTWISGGSYQSGFEILIDPLSVFMMLVVSGVGGLIVMYSIGYMDGDDEERRYFGYMALFVFSMLLLVQGGNLILLLAGWGMVGLSSYLLIGFWHERPTAIAAAKKAFIMNAIGDATMALALFLLIQKAGSLEFGILGGQYSSTVANLVALGLLGGAVAKSAQLPLQTWLPDAMEGPTPVSALIHAATMVTAGVYLIVRTHAIFEAAPKVQDLAAGLGAATLLLAGLIALVQVDIKRVIAYSTMSQIGYMFVGVGLGAYANGMFHLMTHAFFKALLFMAAGIIIHSLADEQDIRKMGGLRALMPRTYYAFLIGSLALVGIFPFAGFFSKDPILAAAMDSGWYGDTLWVIGLIGTFLTGLYTFRLLFIVFWGEPSPFVREHFHALKQDLVGLTLAIPLAVLAVLSVIGGWIQWVPLWTPITTWLEPVAEPLVEPANWQEWFTSGLALLLGLAGMYVAWIFYGARRATVPRFAFPQRVLEHKFYFDELYDAVFYRPTVWAAKALRRYVEDPIVAESSTSLGEDTRDLGRIVSRAQTGLLRTYALAIASGVAVLAIVFVAVR
jgi:NADH-quinone oxidoreductase subunit L